MRHHKGKSFLAPTKLFRAEKSLYFPNLWGRVLVRGAGERDTTGVLEGRVSVVSLFSGTWAERQTLSFVGAELNPELMDAVRGAAGEGAAAQFVFVNVEENALKAGLIRLFMPGLRKKMPDMGQQGRYFLVRRGLTDEIRGHIGMANGKVGYVYLVDRECKVRWAGSGVAEAGEKQGLVRGVRKLVEEWRGERARGKVRDEREDVDEGVGAVAQAAA